MPNGVIPAGFDVTSAGATVGLPVLVTVAGLLGAARSPMSTRQQPGHWWGAPMSTRPPRALPASGVNTAIVVTLPALGVGNTNAAVVASGFKA